jgi:3-oxoacyl-[acyl-carrier protein] reductase
LVELIRTKAKAEYGNQGLWQNYLGELPLGRAATVREVAEVVTFMSSKRASYMSGVIVSVNGGYRANNWPFVFKITFKLVKIKL